MSTSRAAPEDILQDQIFDLSARNAELTERLAGLVGGASGVAVHEELVQARQQLAAKEAEIADLNEIFCTQETELTEARTERDDALGRALRSEAAAATATEDASAATARADKTAQEMHREATARATALAHLVSEQLGVRLLVSALREAESKQVHLQTAHNDALGRATL